MLIFLGGIFFGLFLFFVLARNSNPNRRYDIYKYDDYEDSEDDEDEDEDEETENIVDALAKMGFKKGEITKALDAVPPDPFLTIEENIKRTLVQLGN